MTFLTPSVKAVRKLFNCRPVILLTKRTVFIIASNIRIAPLSGGYNELQKPSFPMYTYDGSASARQRVSFSGTTLFAGFTPQQCFGHEWVWRFSIVDLFVFYGPRAGSQ